jgi:hypothetical protein
MADRRPEESSVAPRRSLAGGGKDGDRAGGRSETRLDDAGTAKPVKGDSTDDPAQRPSGAERFAAAISAARDKSSGKSPGKGGRGSAGTGASGGVPRKVRKAHLRVTHIDPWSVMKASFLLSIAIGIVLVVAVMVVWSVLGAAGVWDSINRAVTDVLGNETSDSFNVEDYLGMSRVLGFTMIVAVVDVVLLTVIATLGAFLYNLAAVLLGGVEVTLAEDERPVAGGS